MDEITKKSLGSLQDKRPFIVVRPVTRPEMGQPVGGGAEDLSESTDREAHAYLVCLDSSACLISNMGV
jgi:hypothetical protein